MRAGIEEVPRVGVTSRVSVTDAPEYGNRVQCKKLLCVKTAHSKP